MYRVVLLAHAKEDIKKASLWYNKQEKGLGKRFSKNVRDAVEFIKENPFTCSVRYKNIRTVIIKKFPYMLHYSIDEENKLIVIYSVIHTKRNPKY